jgi:hypothetical protein
VGVPHDSDGRSEREDAAASDGFASVIAAPSAELAETLMARECWQALEPVLLILIEDGPVTFPTAVSWMTFAHEALDGLSPAQWVADGRDTERLLRVARQDAARLGQ